MLPPLHTLGNASKRSDVNRTYIYTCLSATGEATTDAAAAAAASNVGIITTKTAAPNETGWDVFCFTE